MKINNAGFTLVEATLTSMLIVALGVGVAGLQYVLGQSQLSAFNSYSQVDDSNFIVSGFVRDLRTARSGGNGAYALELADDNQIIFYSDVDFDGEVEKVRYFLENSTTLSKGVIEPVGYPVTYPPANEFTKTISTDIKNQGTPLFTYYNGDWPTDTINNPLPTPANLLDTKLVRVSVVVNPTNNTRTDYQVSSFVQIRTLKTNL